MTSKEPRDKKACIKQYHKHLKSLQPKYPYHFRLWTSSDLVNLADDWYERDKSLDQIIAKKYPLYVKGEYFLREMGLSRNVSLYEVKSEVEKIFAKFQKMTPGFEDEPDLLFDEGFESFFTTVLKQPFTPLNKLIFAYIFNLDYLGDVTKEDFIGGFTTYGCQKESIMKTFFETAIKNLTSPEIYAKDFYTGIFNHVSVGATRDRVQVNRAVMYWGILTPVMFPAFNTSGDWILWLKKMASSSPQDLPPAVHERTKSWLKRPTPGTNDPVEITKDLWSNFYDFANKMKDDYVKNYDFDGGDAWNTAFDQFVFDFLDIEYARDEED